MTPEDRGARPEERRDGESMTPERWARIEALFTAALERDPAERAAFLAGSGEPPAVVREVESLLAARDEEPDFLETRPPWLAEPAGPAVAPDTIGPYRILDTLGRGGMGTVYLAEREAPGFRQRVALKLMRRGMDTDDLLARFRAERQILASLDHPNIARVFDVGATPDGLPYFVMEHVAGVSLLEYCERERLGVAARLRLFMRLCSAVHHAHQSLVIHRDLKPGNILVTAEGVPKLLDFGVAKILDPGRLDVPANPTRAELRLLTPEYAAPEQLLGEPITTACDVYALGLLLYEMLAGRRPFGDGGRAELERRVLERDPPPPASVAPPERRRAIAGDLDNITLRALRKEPGERYPSALALADDIRRHLEGLPVEARTPTVRYRLRKFVRRNRIPVAAGIALFLVLSGSTGLTLYQSSRIREESARVARERDKALEVRSFLLETFGTTGPDQPTGETPTVRELLDGRAATVETSYPDDPELRAEMMSVLAEGYEKLGLFREAEPLAREALALRRELFGEWNPDVAQSLNVLGWLHRELGDVDRAERLLRQSVEVGRAVFPPEGDARLARALNDLGVVLEARGAHDEAAALYAESLDMRKRVLGPDHLGVAITTSNLAVVLYRQGEVERATELAGEAVTLFRDALGPDHQRTVIARGNLAALHGVRDRHAEAVEQYREILARHRRVLGPDHANVGYTLMMLGNELVQDQDFAPAEPLLVEALRIQRERLGPAHDRVALNLRVLGDAVGGNGRPEEALEHYRVALGIVRAANGDDHHEVGILRLRLGRTLAAMGRAAEAERRYREAIETLDRAVGADHYLAADARLHLVELALDGGDRAVAAPLLERVESAVASLGPFYTLLQERTRRARERLDVTPAS